MVVTKRAQRIEHKNVILSTTFRSPTFVILYNSAKDNSCNDHMTTRKFISRVEFELHRTITTRNARTSKNVLINKTVSLHPRGQKKHGCHKMIRLNRTGP